MKLVADLDGITRVAAQLKLAGQRLADPRPLLNDIGSALVTTSRGRFDTQTGPDGKRWQTLAETTRMARAGGKARVFTKKGDLRKNAQSRMDSLRILFRQGHLRNSITHHASRTGVEIGTNLIYGRIHQLGGEAGRGKKITIPARPYLGLSDADQDLIVNLAQSYLEGAVS